MSPGEIACSVVRYGRDHIVRYELGMNAPDRHVVAYLPGPVYSALSCYVITR